MLTAFLNYMNSFAPLTLKEKDMLADAVIVRHVPKKYDLCPIGKIARELYFINSGCIQLFCNKDGEDITFFIATEGMMIGSIASFLSQQPSVQGLRTIEDCELLVLKKSAMENLYNTMPKMNLIGRKIAEQRLIHAQGIVSSFAMNKPEERYLQMIEQRPELLQRVPQHILAGFLGVTPVSLSRIRKRLG